MTCTDAAFMTELKFVLALRERGLEECCRGPLLRLALMSYRLFTLEQIFASDKATDLLWDGVHPDGQLGTHFSLCGAHWLDLCALVWVRAQQYRRSDWLAEADQLLTDVCRTAGWDPKEIVNMFSWQRTELT